MSTELCVCRRCGHYWQSRLKNKGKRPKQCPDCKNQEWDKETLHLICKNCDHDWVPHNHEQIKETGEGHPRRCPKCDSSEKPWTDIV